MCLQRYDESGPALRAALERAADCEPLSEEDRNLVFRGLYILAARLEQSAFEPLLRLLRRDEDELRWLLSGAVTVDLPCIVASVFDGNADALFDLIGDRELDEFVRDSLMGAARFLTFDGRIERERMLRFLERFYEEPLAEDDAHVWIGWVETVGMLGLRSLTPLVEKAWSERRIPEGIMEMRHFQEDLAAAEDAPNDIGRFEKVGLGYMADPVEALEWTRVGREEEDGDDDPGERGERIWRASSFEPFVNPMRHVGRNDPCPCGSGKKAKRCCLATG